MKFKWEVTTRRVTTNKNLPFQIYSSLCYWDSFQNSHLQLFYEKAVLKNYQESKHLWWSLFRIKLQAYNLKLYSKRDSGTSAFLWNSQNISEPIRCRTSSTQQSIFFSFLVIDVVLVSLLWTLNIFNTFS